jgi:hypothetical protein
MPYDATALFENTCDILQGSFRLCRFYIGYEDHPFYQTVCGNRQQVL